MFGNRFSSSTNCSGWLHETAPGRPDPSLSCLLLKVATHPANLLCSSSVWSVGNGCSGMGHEIAVSHLLREDFRSLVGPSFILSFEGMKVLGAVLAFLLPRKFPLDSGWGRANVGNVPFSTGVRALLSDIYRYLNYRLVLQSARVHLLQSARESPYKVPVDKLNFPQGLYTFCA